MADSVNLGLDVASLKESPRFDAYTRVELKVGDATFYAGSETGRTMTVESLWGDQGMANDILASIAGYEYQPYKATGAIVDPSVELGDGVLIQSTYGGMYSQDITFSSVMRSNIGADADEEIDHEFHFESPERRAAQRLAGTVGHLSGAFGGLSNKVDEFGKEVFEARSGLAQISNWYVNPETGEKEYYITEAALYAELIDKGTGAVKSSRIAATSIYDPKTGKYKSLAQITADVIELEGRVDLTGILTVEGDGIHTNGPITTTARVHTKNLTVTSGVITMGASESGSPATFAVTTAGSMILNNTTYTPQEITSTDGQQHHVLGYAP